MEKKDAGAEFAGLAAIIKALRTPGTGCPWDLEQDHLSLRPYLLEEAHEVLQAIEAKDDHALSDELGDVLLQVVLHAQLAAERGAFDISDVIRLISEKMVRRHPHVFGNVQVGGSADVLQNWEAIKLKESALKDADRGEESETNAENSAPSRHPVFDRLNKIPRSIPSLLRAQRIGEKAARVHFDWQSVHGVLAKVHEELGELEAIVNEAEQGLALRDRSRPWPPMPAEHRAQLEHELGDLLFGLCQLARWLGISAEDSLRTASALPCRCSPE